MHQSYLDFSPFASLRAFFCPIRVRIPFKHHMTRCHHVPPQCLAPLTDDSIFYKLPAHEGCNKALSVQESRFLDYVTAYAKNGIQEADDAFEKMLRNFGRGKEKRGGFPNKDFYRLYNNVVLKEGYTPNGIYIGPVIGIRPPEDLDYKSVLIKIARGLHYYHSREEGIS